MTESVHDLAAVYALDALDEDERRRFEEHLEGCEDCRREIASFRDSLAELSSRSGVAPPARVREAVMARLAATPQESAGESTTEAAPIDLSRGRRMAMAIAAVAAVAALALAAVLIGGLFDENPIEAVLAADDARQITLASEAVEGAHLTFSPRMMQAVFTASGLPPIGDEKTYELWLIDDAGATPAGIFLPDADGGASVLVEGEVTSGLTLGLTVEPAAGSSAPTGDILIAQPIS
ncbi:MAG: anti-sigma factor [Candidatus Limnocylindria bacterium]